MWERKKLFQEGVRHENALFVEKGALTFPEIAVPVVDGTYPWGDWVGIARDFERDNEGWISAEVSFNEGVEIQEGYTLAIYIWPVKSLPNRGKPSWHVIKGKIHNVSFLGTVQDKNN